MSAAAAVLFPDLEGHWFSVSDSDPRGLAFYLRHYSSAKARGSRSPIPLRGNAAKFAGPGATLALLTAQADAFFLWRKQDYRKDGQAGVECSIFRNESALLSSDLIREACQIAWSRWPGKRLFTFVDEAKTQRRRSRRSQPGACFIHAGWTLLEQRTKQHGHRILEILPSTSTRGAPCTDPEAPRAAVTAEQSDVSWEGAGRTDDPEPTGPRPTP